SQVVKEITLRLSTVDSTKVREVMIPRIDMVAISLKWSLEEIISAIRVSGHSRIPVWDKSIDDIVGILYVKDLFHNYFNSNETPDISSLLRPAYFIPESMHIPSLLKDFQKQKTHLAIVVDEYGGVSGIISLEDVLEEIVGEIQDEYDDEEDEVVQLEDNVYLIDSRMDMGDLNEGLGLDLPTDQSETIGGFVFDLFGRVPLEKEMISRENIDFEIADIEGNKINKIRIILNEANNVREENGGS
ncbi:MAG: hemolysin family protein, partial [Spirochaetota bacterium]|nr:hemolysin family protein [Spirochaetota bacterium]